MPDSGRPGTSISSSQPPGADGDGAGPRPGPGQGPREESPPRPRSSTMATTDDDASAASAGSKRARDGHSKRAASPAFAGAAPVDDGEHTDGNPDPAHDALGPISATAAARGGKREKAAAKVACMPCREAKIKCSTPNDGDVPCSRCARKELDCHFEKHKRGRKPGKLSSTNKFQKAFDHLSASADSADGPSSSILAHDPVPSSSRTDHLHPEPPPHVAPPNGHRPPAGVPRSAPFYPFQTSSIAQSHRYPYAIHDGRPSTSQGHSPSGPSSSLAPLPHFANPFSTQPTTNGGVSIATNPGPSVTMPGLSQFSTPDPYAPTFSPLGNLLEPPASGPSAPPPQPSSDRNGHGRRSLFSPHSSHSPAMHAVDLSGARQGKPASSGASSASGSVHFGGVTELGPQPADEADGMEDDLGDASSVDDADLDLESSRVLSNPLRLLAHASDAAELGIEGENGGPDDAAAALNSSLGVRNRSGAPGRWSVGAGVGGAAATAAGAGQGGGGANASDVSPGGNREPKRPRLLGNVGRSTSFTSVSVTGLSDAGEDRDDTALPSASSLRRLDAKRKDRSRSRGRHGGGGGGSGGSGSSRAHDGGGPSMSAWLGDRFRSATASSGNGVGPDGGAGTAAAEDADVPKPEGAARKGYFHLSLFHSKLDDESTLDPVALNLIEAHDVVRLFDFFYEHVNPVLNLLDPYLCTATYVRMRSAFLTTVICALAARFCPSPEDAQLATRLENHTKEVLLPHILLEGYKSVEIAQSFLILAAYYPPTNTLVDDRSWQYVGFSLRIATEIGVNRRVTPSNAALGNEQVQRRVRNRERLWFSLFLFDRMLSAQTGRPWTISDDRLIVQSVNWHKQRFALPSDEVLVRLMKLRRTTARHVDSFDNFIIGGDSANANVERRLASLEFFRKNANADLERWKERWCERSSATKLAIDHYRLYYYHARLLLNSLVLQSVEDKGSDEEFKPAVYVDCWSCAVSIIGIMLDDIGEKKLVFANNALVVMAVYAAIFALRLTKLDPAKFPFVDKTAILIMVRKLASVFAVAGRTPPHRSGAAAAYAGYLTAVLSLWDGPPESAAASTSKAARSQGQPSDAPSAGPGSVGSGPRSVNGDATIGVGGADSSSIPTTLGADASSSLPFSSTAEWNSLSALGVGSMEAFDHNLSAGLLQYSGGFNPMFGSFTGSVGDDVWGSHGTNGGNADLDSSRFFDYLMLWGQPEMSWNSNNNQVPLSQPN